MMLGLFRAGVFVNPMGTKIYLSLAHDVDSFEDFEARLVHVLMHLRQ
jgi:glutamate-1-semialdehyde 2,1-aminomutase